MAQLNGGHALIEALDRAGIRLVLGVPGAGQYEAVDALYQHPRIRYVSLRHEQASSYMADGYARVTGKPAAIIVVPGPGLFNATAGIATAYACSSPMLVISGSDRIKAGQGDEVTPALQSLTKWSARAKNVAEIPPLVHEAMQQTRSGRPRPVGLEVPQAVLAAASDGAPQPAVSPAANKISQEAIQQAAALMASAQRPLIWAGSGIMSAAAWSQLQQLAERWRAPVVTTRSGKGALSDRHPLALGFAETRYAPLRQFINDADVILAVGTSQNLSKFPAKLIRIDADPQVVTGASGVEVLGDAALALDALLAATPTLMPQRPQVEQEVAALNAARFNPADQLQPQWDFMQAIRAAVPDETVLVQGMNQMGYYSRNYWPTYAPRAYCTSSSLATLGAAWPIALGATLGIQEQAAQRPVVVLCGDGGFLYNAQELATAVQYNIPTVIVLFNDNAYGNVLRAQEEQFDGRVIGTKLHNPDFVRFADSFGVWTKRAKSASELGEAVREAVAARRPALIEVPVGPLDRVY